MTTPAAPASDTTTPAIPIDPGAIAARDAELTQLFEHDPMRYRYADGGKHATEHLAIRKAQQAKDTQPDGAEQTGQQVAQQPHDPADDIDLDAPAEGLAEAEASDAERVDTSAYVFEPAEGEEVTEAGQARIDAFAEFAAKNGLAPEAYQGAIDWYNNLVKQEQVRLAEADKVAQKAAVETMGGKEAYAPIVSTAKTVLKSWTKDLQDAVREARTSDGRRLALMPEFVRALANMGDRQATTQPKDDRTAMQTELAEIDTLMHQDTDNLYRPWRNTGVSASERRLQIMREMHEPTPKPSAESLRIEEAELVALFERDPMVFQYTPNWRGTNQTAAGRLHQIRSGRA